MIGGGDACAALLSLGEESKGGGMRGLGSVGRGQWEGRIGS